MLYLALGTGVGGALLLNGRVHHGAHWSGGEFGHILLTTDEAAPRRTLEEWASGPGLLQTWRELSGSDSLMTGEQIAAEAARDPDSPAAHAVTRTGECLGFGLAGLANALDPDLIVIGGGLAALGDSLLNPAARICANMPCPARRSVRSFLRRWGKMHPLSARRHWQWGTHPPHKFATSRSGRERRSAGAVCLNLFLLPFREEYPRRRGRWVLLRLPRIGAGGLPPSPSPWPLSP